MRSLPMEIAARAQRARSKLRRRSGRVDSRNRGRTKELATAPVQHWVQRLRDDRRERVVEKRGWRPKPKRSDLAWLSTMQRSTTELWTLDFSLIRFLKLSALRRKLGLTQRPIA